MAHPGVIFGVAFGATTLSAMSGGSSSLLTTPAWLALGFPLPTAVGADKVAGTFWTLVGARNYLRHRPVDWRLLAGMIAVGLVGAVLGAAVTASVNPGWLKRVVGGLIVAAVALVAFRPAVAQHQHEPRLSRSVVAAVALPLGFYEGLLVPSSIGPLLPDGLGVVRRGGGLVLVARRARSIPDDPGVGWCGGRRLPGFADRESTRWAGGSKYLHWGRIDLGRQTASGVVKT